MYENSIEEQKYLSLIRKEKDAFEKLIREKSVSIQCLYAYLIYIRNFREFFFVLTIKWR